MRFSTAVAAAIAVAPVVFAHDGPSMPRIAGLNMRDLKARDMFAKIQARAAELEGKDQPHVKKSKLDTRQVGGTDGQCGAGVASCAAGYCCSPAGWCGLGSDYCYSPGCQYQYGPGCPENQTPGGTNTSSVTRTKLGSVAYGGAGIYSCVEDGMVAITYDDGPLQNYTDHILDIFANYAGAAATFFITGNNLAKGEIDATPELTAVIQKAHTNGHQIASHTWTHLDLSAISQADRLNQMYKNEMALRNILQFFPTYMRPPYSSCTGQCETDLANLGYHVIYFDIDTDDYEQDDPNLIQNSKNWFLGNLTAGGATASNSGHLSISHDIHMETAYNLTDYMLSTITSMGYTAVTVGECLGDPAANWYRASSGSVTTASSAAPASSTSSAPAVSATAVSTDATCGGSTGNTCAGSTFGNCCSSAGWCGSTTDYCGTGCQSSFGTCGSSSSSSSSASSSASSSSSTHAASSSTSASSVRSSTSSSSAAAASSTLKVSSDATCGGTSGNTCQGSSFGNCCSTNGWCGSTTDYCGTGCQSGFGTCGTSSSSSSSAKASSSSSSVKTSSTSSVKTSSSTSSVKTSSSTSTKTSTSTLHTSSTKASSSAAATSTLKVSTDGTCAGTTKQTCKGSTFGNCCSQYGYCGSTTAYCGTGCLTGYGTCT